MSDKDSMPARIDAHNELVEAALQLTEEGDPFGSGMMEWCLAYNRLDAAAKAYREVVGDD